IGVPSMITRTSGDIRNIQDMVLSALRIIVPAPVMLVGGIAMAVAMNPELAKILLVIIPIIVVIVLIVAKFAIPIFKKLQRLTDALNQVMREKLSGIRVIKAFNRTEYEDGRFKATNFELTSITLKVQRIFAAFMPVAILAGFSLMLFIMWKMGIKLNALDPAIDSEKLEIVQTLGNTTAFITYIAIVISAVSMAAGMFIQIPKAAISAKRLREVFDMVPDIKESETPIEFNRDKRGDLDFKNVCFKYPGEEKSILSDISFSSKKGEITAIIGGTGSGKTTLISLIPRLYDITEGEIYLGGVSIRDIPLKTLHSKIAYIPQKAFLFSGTIADNLRYGKEDATEYEMDKALEIAQAKNFVMKMEEGKESLVSQSGANLSGGQRQRLAIARAIIKKSDICIFDDSFSALDLATDSRLRAAIRENLADTNVIIVAQRVGTVLDADRIIVMDGGRAVGMGKHRDLIETCGVYREIVSSQLSEEALL
ncbi:MAG: ABC transporter ATP-binding protein/permease, partial [Oscillospiraceae bacterium]|nr:ABC transporter ATP-binding protein/permease [Oscillospiraceae bacterium]